MEPPPSQGVCLGLLGRPSAASAGEVSLALPLRFIGWRLNPPLVAEHLAQAAPQVAIRGSVRPHEKLVPMELGERLAAEGLCLTVLLGVPPRSGGWAEPVVMSESEAKCSTYAP